MVITAEEVQSRYPIHWMVWNSQFEELNLALNQKQFTPEQMETKDPHGRTPLLLAVTLGYTDAVRTLLDAGADVNCESDGWSAVHEATATGDPELLSLVLSRRDYQRHVVRSNGVPDLLRRLSMAPDFYVEMKWEFTSWLPLVSRMCPSDTYKVYKRGSNVRVDTTLVGFENNRWRRGDRTYIFSGRDNEATLIELDHELKTSWRGVEQLKCARGNNESIPSPSTRVIEQRLNTPIAINYLDTDKISFERNKAGIWGWRHDKTEAVNGFSCKVFSATNVELVSKTRTEHLQSGHARESNRSPLAGLLSLAEKDDQLNLTDNVEDVTPEKIASPITWEEYFSEEQTPNDVGRPRQVRSKVQRFRANLWLCEEYPLELQEQIMPVLELMAAMSSPHIARLKDFIEMQLPSGFPLKIEIPLFQVLNARITFGNIFATETPVPNVENIKEGDRLTCVVEDTCFDIPNGYLDSSAMTTDRHYSMDDEEELLQYAIEQSLMEAGTHDDQVDVWEALSGARPNSPAPKSPAFDHEERQLQRAIELSLNLGGVSEIESDLLLAMELSAKEHAMSERETADEQREMEEAIRLSLQDMWCVLIVGRFNNSNRDPSKSRLRSPLRLVKVNFNKNLLSPKRIFHK